MFGMVNYARSWCPSAPDVDTIVGACCCLTPAAVQRACDPVAAPIDEASRAAVGLL